MSPRRFARRDAVSAGGVVYRRSAVGVEVVLVARPDEGLWALPKGTPEPGESLEQTAQREVQEETGLLVRIERPIGEIHYRYVVRVRSLRVEKVVHHYLMEPRGGDVADHDHEYDIAAWVEAQDAMRRLTYDNERDMLRRALELLEFADEGDGGRVDGRRSGGSREAAG